MKGSNTAPHFRYTLCYLLFALLFCSITAAMVMLSLKMSGDTLPDTSAKDTLCEASKRIIIIDAGHGGEDGGAIGINGVHEKDLNLMIAKDLAEILLADGNTVILTRDSDVMLYDRNVNYKGRKKLLDLSERLKIAEKYEDCIFVSIHMNSFPEEKYSGLQVYYSPNAEESALLAEKIQGSVSAHLQPDNERSIKRSGSSIFLLDRIRHPAVLIECGFISNTEECALLCDKEYRQKLTLSIFCGICEYFSENNS